MWDHNAGQGMTPQQANQQTSQRQTNYPAADAAHVTHDEPVEHAERDETASRALDALTADDAAYAALSARGSAATALTEAMRRAQTRALIREFLRAVPRGEESAVLPLVRADGVTRLLTRTQLTTAIDRLRPRQRQIVRLGIEERWPRQKVCAYLRGISMKTLERDQAEALDILAQL
jgi:hypothetical protein